MKKFVLSHGPLGVAIAILHIEWITLRHYIEGVRDNQDLDPQFKSLLKHHWLEESQHTKLDTLIVEELAAHASGKEIDQAFQEYAEIGGFLDEGIKQQSEFDVEAFIAATGRKLSQERARSDERRGDERDALDLSGDRNDASELSRHRRGDQAGGEKTDRGNGADVLLNKNAK